MASSGCWVCPGYAKIWVAVPGAPAADPNNEVPGTFYALPHTITWNIEPNTEDPTEIRTSDTGGLKIAVGAGATSYKLNVTSALSVYDWLYAYILASDGTWAKTLPAQGADLWFFLAWDVDDTPESTITSDSGGWIVTRAADADHGIYCRGLVEPAGYGIDNDSTDPAKAEWSANITAGPYLPESDTGTLYGEDTPPFSLSTDYET